MSPSETTTVYSSHVSQDKTPAPRPPATMSMLEAAALMGVSERAVRIAVEMEQIRYIRIGKYIRILRAPLLEQLGLPPDYEMPD
jgi:excisionase family DNA binding protein